MISGIHHKLISQLWCKVRRQLPAEKTQWECGVYPQSKQVWFPLGCTHAQRLFLGAEYLPLWISSPVPIPLPGREFSLPKGNLHIKAETTQTIVSEWCDTKQENPNNIKIFTDLRARQTEKKKRDMVPEWRKLSFLDHTTKKMHICLIIHSPLMHVSVKWYSFCMQTSLQELIAHIHTNSPMQWQGYMIQERG